MKAPRQKTTLLRIPAATPLERHVLRWINARAADYPGSGAAGVLKDVFYGGCASGMVGHLISYTDTTKFYKRYQGEIDALLRDILQETGSTVTELFRNWDADDPLARDDENMCILAWFGWEETARKLADRAGIDV
jgi:hypothetical protein